MYCNQCGGQIPIGSKFCPSCGAEIAQNENDFCAYCGAQKRTTDIVCPKCGREVEPKQIQPKPDDNESNVIKEYLSPIAKRAVTKKGIKCLALASIILLTFIMMLMPVYNCTYEEEKWQIEIWRDGYYGNSRVYKGDYDSTIKNSYSADNYHVQYVIYGDDGYRDPVTVEFPAINNMSDEDSVSYLNYSCEKEESTSFGFKDEDGDSQYFFFMYDSDWESVCVPIFQFCFIITLILAIMAMVLAVLPIITDKMNKIPRKAGIITWFSFVLVYVLTWLILWSNLFFTDGKVSPGLTFNGVMLLIISAGGLVFALMSVRMRKGMIAQKENATICNEDSTQSENE